MCAEGNRKGLIRPGMAPVAHSSHTSSRSCTLVSTGSLPLLSVALQLSPKKLENVFGVLRRYLGCRNYLLPQLLLCSLQVWCVQTATNDARVRLTASKRVPGLLVSVATTSCSVFSGRASTTVHLANGSLQIGARSGYSLSRSLTHPSQRLPRMDKQKPALNPGSSIYTLGASSIFSANA